MLQLQRQQWLEMVAHSFACLPEEACGLMSGRTDGVVDRFWPCPNADHSARTYAIYGRDLLRVEQVLDDEAGGASILGVMHSHTHTDPYPSPTDVERAALLGGWHFLIVSLRHPEPEGRSYRIDGGLVVEEPITLSEA